MEQTALIVASFLHVGKEGGDEGAEEAGVGLARSVGVPTEDALVLAVDGGHHLGRVTCTPLGEEVGDLEEFNAHAVTHVDPTIQLVEAEGVLAVGDRNVQKLYRGALTADGRIQRGGEQGGQQEVDAVAAGCSGEILYDLPVALRPCLAVVVVGQTVAMEPLGDLHGLGRQLGVHDLHGDLLGGHGVLARHEADGDFVGSCLQTALGIQLDPHGAELVLHDRDHAAVVQGLEPVGVETGLLGQVVVVTDLGVDGIGYGDKLYGTGIDVLGGDTLDPEGDHGAVGGVVARHRMEELEGEPLILHHAGEGKRTVVLDAAVQKGLFERGDQFCLEHGGTSFRRRCRVDLGGFSIAYFGGEVKRR